MQDEGTDELDAEPSEDEVNAVLMELVQLFGLSESAAPSQPTRPDAVQGRPRAWQEAIGSKRKKK